VGCQDCVENPQNSLDEVFSAFRGDGKLSNRTTGFVQVLERNGMQAFSEKPTNVQMPLHLLLFVDKRPSSQERIRQVHETLGDLRAEYAFELEVVDVSEQPYLAEHFRLIATPALVKIYPTPQQTLAGSDLVAQLRHSWPY